MVDCHEVAALLRFTQSTLLGYCLREDGQAPEKDNIHDHTIDAPRYFVVNLLGAEETKVWVKEK